MAQRRRLLLGLVTLIVLAGAILLAEFLRRGSAATVTGAEVTLAPGSIPIYQDRDLVAGFTPADLERLEKVTFTDPEDGKVQDGWLLRDVILLYIPAGQLSSSMRVIVSSSSRGKSAELAWGEVDDRDNLVMFDLSNRGTLKLVSRLEKLDTRDEWIQDADKIEIAQP